MKRYLPIIVTVGVILLVLIVLTYWKPEKKDILDGTIWQVEELKSTSLHEFSTLTLRFHNEKISGSSECNTFKGRYEITGELIAIEVLERTTEKCMEPDIIELDNAFIDSLENAKRLSYTGNNLMLLTDDGQELINFVLMAD